jgi:hypothetical protein
MILDNYLIYPAMVKNLYFIYGFSRQGDQNPCPEDFEMSYFF